MTTFDLKKSLLNAVCVALFIAVVVVDARVISVSSADQQSKLDYAEIHHIKYGLFSIDEWKNKLSDIVLHEMDRLKIDRSNEHELKALLDSQLGGLIDQVVLRIKKSNETSVKGRMKQAFINSFVDINEIKKGIPQYSDEILRRLNEPRSRRTLRNALKTKVETYLDRTFEDQDLSQLNEILRRTDSPDVETAKSKIQVSLEKFQKLEALYSWIMIALAAGLFVIVSLSKSKRLSPFQYFAMLGSLLGLLLAGVLMPMIDLEAKISEMSFVLLGQPLKFTNQVLYFQSKSIINVFEIMFSGHALEMKAVGMLMVTFSIIFPLLKMFSTVIFYYKFRGWDQNKIVRFFVLKSGKWSVADVLVVAIFMAYIGFNGVLSSQLDQLGTSKPDMTLLTTNGTALQPGFFVFLTYTILALWLSTVLERHDENYKSS